MYAVLMQDPCICDVLEGAVLEEDGTVSVQGADGMMTTSARLEHLHRALQELQTQHLLYRSNPAVRDVITKMSSILQQRSSEAATRPVAENEELQQAGAEDDDQQFTYLVPKDPKVPRADLVELRQTRGQLADDATSSSFRIYFQMERMAGRTLTRASHSTLESDCWGKMVALNNPHLTSCGSWKHS